MAGPISGRRALPVAAAAALALSAGPGAAQLSLLGLQNSLVQFLLSQVSVEGVFEIEAEGVEEPRDGVTELVGVTIADADGIWLRADGVALSWSPTRLLRAEIEINELTVRGLDVARLPTPPEVVPADDDAADDDAGPFAWPRAPLTTRVESLRIDGARLAEGVVAPQSLSFEAEGSFVDERGLQSLSLSLDRTDTIEGEVRASYARNFREGSLTLDLRAEEAPGGVVAALAGLPEGSAARLWASAAGPLSDWGLELSAEAERVVSLDASAQLDLSAPVSAEATLELRPGEALAPEIAAAMGEAATLDLSVAEADGLVTVERARLASPALSAGLSGRFRRSDRRMDFDLSLAAEPPLAAALDGVLFPAAADGAGGRVEGPVEDFEATGRLTLAGLATAAADLARGGFDVTLMRTGDDLSVEATGEAEGLRLDRLEPDLLGTPALRVAGSWNLADQAGRLETFALDSPALSVTASGEADLAANRAALDYAASAPALGPIAAAYGADAAGRFAAEGRLSGPLDAPGVVGRLTLDGLAFEGRDLGAVALEHDVTLRLALDAAPQGDGLLPGSAESVAGRVSLTAEGSDYGPASLSAGFGLGPGALRLEGLEAEALTARLTGDLTADLAALTADGRLSLVAEDLSRAAALGPGAADLGLAGSATAEAVLSAEDGRQDARVEADVDDLTAAGAEVARLRLEADLTDLGGAGEAAATLQAAGLAYPTADLGLEMLAGRVTAADLTGAPRVGFALEAAGLTAPDAEVARLTLSGEGRDLTGAGPLRFEATAEAVAAGGATVADVTLSGDAADLTGAPSVRFEAEATGIGGPAEVARVTASGEATDLTGAPSARLDAVAERIAAGDAAVARVTLSAEGDDLIAAPSGRATVSAETVALTPEASLATLDLVAEGRAEDLTVTLRGRGRFREDPLTLDLDADGALAGEGAAFVVSAFSAAAGEIALRLRTPLTLRREGDATRAEGLDLELPAGGRLTGDGALHPGGVQADLDLAWPDLAPLADLAEAPVAAGALSAALALDSRAASPSGRFDLDISGLEVVDASEARALALAVEALWDGATLAADGTASGGFGQPATIEARLPLVPAGLLPAVPARAELDAALRWSGEIGDLWALVPAPDHLLTGRLDLDLGVSGPLGGLQPSGSVALADGAYQNLETGTILRDLTLSSDLLPGGGLALSLTGNDGAGGPVEVRAEIADGALDASATTREAVLVRRDDVTAAITADIAAAGPLAAPAITGDVLIDRAEVRLIVSGAPGLPDLGDVRIKGEPEPEPMPEREGGPTLDLTIRAPGDVFVRGRGLDSEWEIDLAVAGPVASPRITGRVEKRRGTLNFVGRNFSLERGLIRFGGREPIDPALDVMLEHERPEITGRIVVGGFASDPRLSFESVPAQPEDEVLPRVLFGQSRQSLSPGQALQLAIGVATLLNGSEGLLGGVRAAAGLDVLSVDLGDEDEAASVTAGSDVADGVFVGVKQPLDGGQASVLVEVEVLDNLTVESETGADSSSIGVGWRWDF